MYKFKPWTLESKTVHGNLTFYDEAIVYRPKHVKTASIKWINLIINGVRKVWKLITFEWITPQKQELSYTY